MPGYPCCCGKSENDCDARCTVLTRDAATVSLSISGWTGSTLGDCDCPDLDGTYVLTHAGNGLCLWTYDSSDSCSVDWYLVIDIDLTLTKDVGGKPKWTLLFYYLERAYSGGSSAGGTVTYEWTSSTTDPIDCSAQYTLTYVSTTGSWCTYPSTCQIN